MKRLILSILISLFLLVNFTGCKDVDNNDSLIDSTTETIATGNLPTDNISLMNFTLKIDDGSAIITKKDNVFYWYKNPDDTKDNYYKGLIKFYQGQSAYDAALNFPEKFGFSKELLDNVFSAQGGGKLENFYVMTLTFTQLITEGKETTNFETPDYYFGFWMPEQNKLVLKNMSTGNDVYFTVIKNND